MPDQRSDPPGPPVARRHARERARGAYLPFPLWVRLALSLTVAAGLGVALVLYVSRHNTDSGPTNESPAASVQANRDAAILEAQDQAPHSARLESGLTAAVGLRRAIRVRVSRLISTGAIVGPLRRVRCAANGSRGTRTGFGCRALAGGVSYPFLGVVDTESRRITFCKRDPPAIPSQNVPISTRCRA